MHLFFAIGFFGLIALGETLRHGIFGLTGAEMALVKHAVMAAMVLFILRGDLVHLVRPSAQLYGRAQFGWSWARSGLAAALGALVFVPVAIWGAVTGQVTGQVTVSAWTPDPQSVLLMGSALIQALFLREAVLKGFADSPALAVSVSVLSTFILYMPMGAQAAAVAAGLGVFFVSLRLIGANALIVGALHGTYLVVMGNVLSPSLTAGQGWAYAGLVWGALGALSYGLHRGLRPYLGPYQGPYRGPYNGRTRHA